MSNCCATGDCPECRSTFQTFVDGEFNDPQDCPQSVAGKCPKCYYDLKSGYGFAGDYGIGIYQRCPKCGEIYDFVPEPCDHDWVDGFLMGAKCSKCGERDDSDHYCDVG